MVDIPQLGDYDGGPDLDDETIMVGCEMLQSYNVEYFVLEFCRVLQIKSCFAMTMS